MFVQDVLRRLSLPSSVSLSGCACLGEEVSVIALLLAGSSGVGGSWPGARGAGTGCTLDGRCRFVPAAARVEERRL